MQISSSNQPQNLSPTKSLEDKQESPGEAKQAKPVDMQASAVANFTFTAHPQSVFYMAAKQCKLYLHEQNKYEVIVLIDTTLSNEELIKLANVAQKKFNKKHSLTSAEEYILETINEATIKAAMKIRKEDPLSDLNLRVRVAKAN